MRRYSTKNRWIELINLPQRHHRHFAGKVHAFNAGYERVKRLSYDVIGNIKCNVSLEPEYFAFLLNKFAEDSTTRSSRLPFPGGDEPYDYRFSRKEHVSGACQLFRRQCFEDIGGYIPLKIGAVDLMANVTARMKGWKTETFPEKFCVHHRQMGSAQDHFVGATFKSGYGDYLVGVHPPWQVSRSVYQMSRRPFILGGMLLLVGYLWGMIKREPKLISVDLVNFRKRNKSNGSMITCEECFDCRLLFDRRYAAGAQSFSK